MLVTTTEVASLASVVSHASAASVASSSSVTSFALPAFRHHRRFSHLIILKKSSQSICVVLLSDRANGRLRVPICVGSGTHVSLEVLEHRFVDQMILCRLSSYTSHKPQPFYPTENSLPRRRQATGTRRVYRRQVAFCLVLRLCK